MQLFNSELDEHIDSDSGSLCVVQPDTTVGSPSIAMDELINEIVGVFDKQGLQPPEIKVPVTLQNIQNNIKLRLEEIFMVIETRNPKSVEFGIWFRLDSSDALKDMFPIAIGDGYLLVWNTGRKAILDRLQKGSPQKLLGC